ncbi:hypothetical protein GCM10010525_35140 [Glutamicibacter bergerei]
MLLPVELLPVERMAVLLLTELLPVERMAVLLLTEPPAASCGAV